MAKIEVSTMVDRPAETVWKFVTDYSNFPKIDPDILEFKQTSVGPYAVGTTFEANRKKEGKVSFRTMEYDPGRKLSLEVTSPRMMEGSKEIVIIEDVGGKTKLTHVWDLRLGGYYRLMGPFVARSLRKVAGTQVSSIKRILETEAPS
jgi:carbon monoxide dehydrogenase subunit G